MLAGRTTGTGRRPRGRDPLSAAEVAAACTAVRERHPGLNFVEVELHEGSSAGASGPGRRRAHVLTYDRRNNATTSHVVAVGAGAGTGAAVVEESVSHGDGQVQPAIDGEEYEAAERLVKRHPPFVAAMRARGVEDVEGRVAVDLWCAGWFSEADSPKRRLGKPLIFLKGGRGGNNIYACPVEGIEVTIDLAKMEIVEFADLERRPLPRPDAYSDFDGETETAEHAAAGLCRPLKPLTFQQAEGPSFSVDGYSVEWWRWKFSVGWTPREGLVLHDVSVGDVDRGCRRQVAQRISFVEMVVPYGDPREPHCRKNAFDAGEDGLGKNAHSLRLNCDCLGGHIWYFDAHQSTWDGGVETIEQAICMHEEDQVRTCGRREERRTDSDNSGPAVEAPGLAHGRDALEAGSAARGLLHLHDRQLRLPVRRFLQGESVRPRREGPRTDWEKRTTGRSTATFNSPGSCRPAC